MAEQSKTVSFRLSDSYAKELAKRADAYGDSIGEHARRIVVGAVTDAGHEALREEVAELRKVVESLREDFATAVVALLSQKGSYSREDAEAWAKKTLLR